MRKPDISPFFFKGRGHAAVLLTHGFTGTPYEMRSLGRALARAGISARGILLPGHECSEDMTHVTRKDWYRAVREAYQDLRSEYDRVGLVGLSMGGLLSLHLASDPQMEVDAVATLAAPMFLYGWQARMLLPVVAASPLGKRWRWEKSSPGNIRCDKARAMHPSLRWCMASALGELRAVLRETRPRLAQVKAPLLIQHGRHDSTALVQSAEILYNRVGSQHKEKIILPESYHVITVDVESKTVERNVVRFMRHWLHSKAPVTEQAVTAVAGGKSAATV